MRRKFISITLTAWESKSFNSLIARDVTRAMLVERTLGSLSTRVFETRTATGSAPFSLLTCLRTTTFTLLSIFYPSEMISIKIWETPLSWHTKRSLPVSGCRLLKLPNKGAKVLWKFDSVIMETLRYILRLFWYQHGRRITCVQSKNGLTSIKHIPGKRHSLSLLSI